MCIHRKERESRKERDLEIRSKTYELNLDCRFSECYHFFLSAVWSVNLDSGSRQPTTNDNKLPFFQLTYPAVVYTLDHEPIYRNTLMMCLMVVLYAINAYLVLFSADFINEIFEFFPSPSFIFRLQILAIAAGNLAVNIFVQIIFIFVERKERKR